MRWSVVAVLVCAAGLAGVAAAGVAASEGYRVLVVFPIASRSHSLLGEGYVRLLLEAGHQVTYITPFPMKKIHRNLTQVTVEYEPALFEEMNKIMDISEVLTGKSLMMDRLGVSFMACFMGESALKSASVRRLLMDPTQRFDLVVAEWFFSELFAGFSALYECPLVWCSSMDVHSLVLRLVDDLPNPAYTPDVISLSNRPPFTFLERVDELWIMLKRIVLNEFVLIPQLSSMYEEHFGPAAASRGLILPPYDQHVYNVSMILANSHASLGSAPRHPQSVKEVGGYHISPPAPLPQDLQKIIDESKHGVIYFSMGSNMKSKDMPGQMKKELLQIFGQFKQTVLWKFEDDTLKSIPANVHVRAWMPQQSVLAHPNVRLFITHGGLLSTTETIHFGVPVVMIPLFGDQFINAKVAVSNGIGLKVDFTYNLAENLKPALEEALEKKCYTDRAKQLSRLYHDRPISPARELVYWLEHVIRSGGAPHLRSTALMVPWYQRLYLDLMAVLLGLLLVVYCSIRAVIRRACGKRAKNKKD